MLMSKRVVEYGKALLEGFQSNVSGKLYIGFSKDKCCYPQDSIKRVAYYMKHDAGIKEFQIKQFDSMLDAMKFIEENNLETVAG